MNELQQISGYRFPDAASNHAHCYLYPSLISILNRTIKKSAPSSRNGAIFDLGCGNGSLAAKLAAEGYQVTGVDPSSEGIAHANREYPELTLRQGSAYDDLAALYGQFPAVISLEVIEHVYSPRQFACQLFELVEPGGIAIVSTPYHGYLKNLALALSGQMDRHFTALWEHGHIKFWSPKTLHQLLTDSGFQEIEFKRVGRCKTLAKSMIAIAKK